MQPREGLVVSMPPQTCPMATRSAAQSACGLGSAAAAPPPPPLTQRQADEQQEVLDGEHGSRGGGAAERRLQHSLQGRHRGVPGGVHLAATRGGEGVGVAGGWGVGGTTGIRLCARGVRWLGSSQKHSWQRGPAELGCAPHLRHNVQVALRPRRARPARCAGHGILHQEVAHLRGGAAGAPQDRQAAHDVASM